MAANVFDVVVKVFIVATNFLKFFSIDNDGVAFMVGASGVGCAAGRIYTGSWLGEGRCKLCSWCSSTAPSPLSSLFNKGRISSFFSHGQTTTQIYKISDNPHC